MRRGVTLLEVLIAIVVASVGLLGSIAVFTAASSNIRKAKLADVSGVAGESAIASFDAQGMREPSRWRYWDAANNQVTAIPANFQESRQFMFGRAFCIDPMGFAHNRDEDAAVGTNNSGLWAWFPAVPEGGAGSNAIPHASRMHRLSLYNGDPNLTTAQASAVAMSYLQADKAFRIEDELLYDRPEDNSLPAQQLFTKMASGTGRRQEEGHLTWFATIVPKFGPHFVANQVGNPVMTDPQNPLGDTYTLSIVVCRDRSGEALHIPNPNSATSHPWTEWTAKILASDFHSNGVGGGEVTITTNDPAQDATFNKPEFLELRSGSWIMLGRTLPAQRRVQRFQWYRVSEADDIVFSGSQWKQDVSLVGSDWSTDMENPLGLGGDGVPEECDVVIMPHVVYVYERTIKIQN